MKKFVLLTVISIACLTVFGQKGYTDFDTLSNVLVKTKLAHANSKDASSPLELSLFFQNTGTTEVFVCYEIYIEDEDTDEIRHSGSKEIKVKPGQKQAGKISNLTYELIGSKAEEYTNGSKRWYFKTLQIKDAATGEILATSSKTEE